MARRPTTATATTTEQEPDALGGEPSRLVVRRLPIAALLADPRNARKHSEENITATASSLREFGQQKAIVVDRTGQIIAGHGTVKAALRLGWTHIEASLSTLEGAKRAGYAVADNRSAELATWDETELARTLRELEAESISHESLGFTDRDLKVMFPEPPKPPEDFPEYNAGNVTTQYKCPKCSYCWSGAAK